ncbi:hypothetical protein FACS1894171_2510 [Clostridia bacterium]|nr:hypothetical protein FACS1894171_2510 [Clostridia bacterium]
MENQIIQEVFDKTKSELIIFFVLVIIAMVAVFLPLYRLMARERGERIRAEAARQDKYIERESRIIDVITANTEVMARLKTTMEIMSASVNSSFSRLHDRVDAQGVNCSEHGTIMRGIEASQYKLLQHLSNKLGVEL